MLPGIAIDNTHRTHLPSCFFQVPLMTTMASSNTLLLSRGTALAAVSTIIQSW